MMKDRIILTAHFPVNLEREARIEAAKRGISRAELVRVAVADYLKRLRTPPATTPKMEATQ